jgi:hypothetical protein
MMNSADDLIGATEMTPAEAAYIHGRLLISTTDPEFGVTINRFSNEYGLMPMLVARTLADIRPSDSNLNSLISTNEFLIKTFGKNRVSRDAVEGGMMKLDRFWRNNDPLGVYQPGDMFYVDDNHPWMPYFPILIFAPTAFVLFLMSVAALVHLSAK